MPTDDMLTISSVSPPKAKRELATIAARHPFVAGLFACNAVYAVVVLQGPETAHVQSQESRAMSIQTSHDLLPPKSRERGIAWWPAREPVCNMDVLLDRAWRQWRNQGLAVFARRAHRQLGRGFVLADDGRSPPIYVTRIDGAPPELIEAVLKYDPEREALVVWGDEPDDDGIIVSCVRIAERH